VTTPKEGTLLTFDLAASSYRAVAEKQGVGVIKRHVSNRHPVRTVSTNGADADPAFGLRHRRSTVGTMAG